MVHFAASLVASLLLFSTVPVAGEESGVERPRWHCRSREVAAVPFNRPIFPAVPKMSEAEARNAWSQALQSEFSILADVKGSLDSSARTHRDADFQELFRQGLKGTSWVGADGAYSIPTDSGSLWLFSDTLRKDAPMIHNSWAWESKGVFRFFPTQIFEPPDQRGWFWVYSGVAKGNQATIFLGQFEETDGPEGFNFGFLRSWLAEVVYSPSGDFEVVRYSPLPKNWGAVAHFGAATVQAGDRTYVYGTVDEGLRKKLVLATVEGGLNDPNHWRFWLENFATGRGHWSPVDPAEPVDIVGCGGHLDRTTSNNGADRPGSAILKPLVVDGQILDVSNELSVWRDGLRFRLLFQRGDAIYHCWSERPEGPFQDLRLCHRIDESAVGGGVFTYNAKVHPQYSDGQGWLVTYNRNLLPLDKLLAQPEVYRPQFLRVP